MSNRNRNSIAAAAMEALEDRMLMSAVINVSPGYQNATSAIQNALNSAGSGGTVNLSAGNYNVSSQLTIPSGVTLQGNGNATLNWTGGTGNLLYSPWNSVGTKVNGVTLNGAGYKIDPDGSNLSITNNTFENISQASAYYGNGLYIPDVETGTTISGNAFNNITGNVGIYIFNAVNTQITNNTFNSDGEAIKGQWFNGGANCTISNNTLNEIFRFGIECQGNPNNLTVSGNSLGNWQQRDSHIGLSIATGEGNNINITNNVILGTGISNPNTAYTAIEAMGNNLTIANNFASGWGWAELVGFTNHWVTENNTWGVNTATYVLEAGGINPSVNSGNVSVSVNDFNAPSAGASTQAVTYASAPTTTPTTTSAPTSTPTTTSAPTTTTAPTSSSGSLPSGWADSDVGSVGRSGSASYANGVYSVAGSGEDVYGNSDAFNYAYQTVNGNSSITARVTSSQDTSIFAKAGIMVRSSLSANAANVYLYQQANGQIIMSDRTSNGGSTADAGAVNSSSPVWLRLVVTGNTVQGYYSTDGSTFKLVGTVNLSLPASAYAGLAVCAQNTGALDNATFDNVSVAS